MWLPLLMGSTAVNSLAEVKGDKGNCSHLDPKQNTTNVRFPDIYIFFWTVSTYGWDWVFSHGEIWELLICFQAPHALGAARPQKNIPPTFCLALAWSHVPLCELGHSWGHPSWQTIQSMWECFQHFELQINTRIHLTHTFRSFSLFRWSE